VKIILTFLQGLISVLKVIGGPMVYRYPYRTSAEGIRADWQSIGKDIKNVMDKLEEHKQHEQRSE
jgi:hypothetical protein